MGRPALDLTGRKFFRLAVIKKSDSKYDGRHAYWDCKCDCGNIITVRKDSLLSGHAKSCGCYLEERRKDGHLKTHGMKGTRLYSIWSSMKQRCCNPKSAKYVYYGGRGISVCQEWMNDFSAFYNWSVENGYKDGLTIDRIDTNGNYEPRNCRWSSYEVQNNNKRNVIKIKIGNREMNLREIEEEYGIPIQKLRKRYPRYKNGKIGLEELLKK